MICQSLPRRAVVSRARRQLSEIGHGNPTKAVGMRGDSGGDLVVADGMPLGAVVSARPARRSAFGDTDARIRQQSSVRERWCRKRRAKRKTDREMGTLSFTARLQPPGSDGGSSSMAMSISTARIGHPDTSAVSSRRVAGMLDRPSLPVHCRSTQRTGLLCPGHRGRDLADQRRLS